MPAVQERRYPLTVLSEEENLFRESVATFADEQLRPHVQSMDEQGKFRPDLIADFFELGLMGVEIPEAYGGAGSTFFMSCLAVEEAAKVEAKVVELKMARRELYHKFKHTVDFFERLLEAESPEKERGELRTMQPRLSEDIGEVG